MSSNALQLLTLKLTDNHNQSVEKIMVGGARPLALLVPEIRTVELTFLEGRGDSPP